MKSFKETLNEGAGLARVVKHMKEDCFGILTAFRGDYTKKQNNERNKNMKGMVRRAGYSYIDLRGSGYVEDGDNEVIEDSIFVICPPDEDFDDFSGKIMDIGNAFDQESVIVSDRTAIMLVFQDGSSEVIGDPTKIKTTDIGPYFSKIKGKKFEFMEGVDQAIRNLEFGETIEDMVEALAEAFEDRRIVFEVFESGDDVDAGDVLFGGWFDSDSDQDGDDSITIDVFAESLDAVLTNEMWTKRRHMLADTIKHELRHRYQYEQRDYIPQRISESYLTNPDEVDAFAINIAEELHREYGDAARLNFKNLNEVALARNEFGELVTPSLYGYWREHFNTSSTMKTLVKKVYVHLDEFKRGETDYGLFMRTKPVIWNKNDPLIHATHCTKATNIIMTNKLLTADPENTVEQELAPEEHKNDRFASFAFSSRSTFVRRVVNEFAEPCVFLLDPRPIRLKYDMYNIDFRDVYRGGRGGIIHRLGLGDEKEIRVYTGRDTEIQNIKRAIQAVYVVGKGQDTKDVVQAAEKAGIAVKKFKNRRELLANLPK